MHPVRFGIQVGPQHISWAELLDVFQAIDDAGFDTGWTFDHFLPIAPGGSRDPWVEDDCLEGWTTLTALGALTKNLSVGCLVTGNTYRHPAVLANMAATVDHITGGRLYVGMGAAWYELEHQMYGIPFYDVPERLRRLNEAVQVLRLLWTEHRATFDGRYYQLTDALCYPKPVQSRLPILIGGAGEKVTARIVARHADAWQTWGEPAAWAHKREVLQRHCDEVGRNIDEIELVMGGPLVLADTDSAADTALEAFAARRNVTLERARSLYVAGGPDTVARRIQEYLDVGVTHFLFNTVERGQAMLQLFAREVIPRFR
ncbi:MAG: TIGR03560 family F420-dependent LLM class oxidoreductase [Dehalococcoidia bacterium]